MFAATNHGTMKVHLTVMKQWLFFFYKGMPYIYPYPLVLGQMEAHMCATEHHFKFVFMKRDLNYGSFTSLFNCSVAIPYDRT